MKVLRVMKDPQSAKMNKILNLSMHLFCKVAESLFMSYLNISFSSVQPVLTDDLGMRCAKGKFVLKVPSADQKQAHILFVHNLLECTENNQNFLKTIITAGEL